MDKIKETLNVIDADMTIEERVQWLYRKQTTGEEVMTIIAALMECIHNLRQNECNK